MDDRDKFTRRDDEEGVGGKKGKRARSIIINTGYDDEAMERLVQRPGDPEPAPSGCLPTILRRLFRRTRS